MNNNQRTHTEGAALFCPRCKIKNSQDAKFCGGCGFDLNAILLCPGCNTEIQPGAVFCSNCGCQVGAQQQPAQTHEPSAAPVSQRKFKKTWGVAVVTVAVVLFVVIAGGQDDLKKSSARELYERFDRLVDEGSNYKAALVMRELCHRGAYSNIHEQGMLGLNCKLVQSASPNDVIFDQGSGSGPIDFKGMARRK